MMDFVFFKAQMGRLAGLKFAPADLTTHWEDLQTLPDAVLEAAVTYAQRARIEFPTPRELRMDADIALPRRPVDEPEPARMTEPIILGYLPDGRPVKAERVWNYYCDDCKDGGWRSVWCGNPKAAQRKPWQERLTCDRRGAHGDHEWTQRCVCYDTNPALVRKRAAAERYAAKPGKVA